MQLGILITPLRNIAREIATSRDLAREISPGARRAQPRPAHPYPLASPQAAMRGKKTRKEVASKAAGGAAVVSTAPDMATALHILQLPGDLATATVEKILQVRGRYMAVTWLLHCRYTAVV